MQKRTTYWLIGCMAIMLLASGCFQAAGTNPQAVSVAENFGPTFTPFPSDTPPPTLTPDTIFIVTTATLDPFNSQFSTVPTLDLGQGGSDLSQSNQVQVPQELSVLDMTATFIVGQATNDAAVQLTGTACALGFCAGTATQTPFIIATAAPLPGNDCIHEVRAEDRNLYRISLVYGVTVDQIVAATTPRIINPDMISIGQRLTIPGCGTTGAVPPPLSTDTPVPGGVIFGTATPLPTGGSVVPGSTYIVKQGDTLFAISLQTGVLVQSIANANGISNIDLIYINQELVIPSS